MTAVKHIFAMCARGSENLGYRTEDAIPYTLPDKSENRAGNDSQNRRICQERFRVVRCVHPAEIIHCGGKGDLGFGAGAVYDAEMGQGTEYGVQANI